MTCRPPERLIEEKNPLKQGLKQKYQVGKIDHSTNWREESIKTRIETKHKTCEEILGSILKRRIH